MNEPNKLLEAMSCSADNTSPVVSIIIFSTCAVLTFLVYINYMQDACEHAMTAQLPPASLLGHRQQRIRRR